MFIFDVWSQLDTWVLIHLEYIDKKAYTRKYSSNWYHIQDHINFSFDILTDRILGMEILLKINDRILKYKAQQNNTANHITLSIRHGRTYPIVILNGTQIYQRFDDICIIV